MSIPKGAVRYSQVSLVMVTEDSLHPRINIVDNIITKVKKSDFMCFLPLILKVDISIILILSENIIFFIIFPQLLSVRC